MNIDFKFDQVQSVLQEAAEKHMVAAFESYEVSQAIRDKIIKSIFYDKMIESLDTAITEIDFEPITEMMAKTLQQTITHVISKMMRMTMARFLADLSGIAEYEREKRDKFIKEALKEFEIKHNICNE